MPPISFAAAALFCALRPATTTFAPAAARPRAMPRPMPPLPPVTTATRPFRSKGCKLSPVLRIVKIHEHVAAKRHISKHRRAASRILRPRMDFRVKKTTISLAAAMLLTASSAFAAPADEIKALLDQRNAGAAYALAKQNP